MTPTGEEFISQRFMVTQGPASPGEVLMAWMEENLISTRVLAVMTRLPETVVEGVLSARRAVDQDVAERLAHGTMIPAALWLRMELAYRIEQQGKGSDGA